MLIAEVNRKRVHAVKDAKGICPYCEAEVIAKCGETKITHWAHKSKKQCDSWHEKDTDWHLMWKNHFPQEWQEIIKYDDNGEKHIADVCTNNGFVLEFQHSPIKPEERKSRENFYKNMNWVVDGTRLKNDYKRFEKNIEKNAKVIEQITATHNQKEVGVQNGYNSNNEEIVKMPIGNLLEISSADELLPKNWLNCSVPVIFDFKGLNLIENSNDLRHYIFCLLPIKDFNRYMVQIPIQIFVETAKSSLWENFLVNCINQLQKYIQHKQQILRQRQFQNLYFYARYPRFKTRKPPRRTPKFT